MTAYHAEPNSYIWFSVETPSVYREYRLPACDTNWIRTDRKKFRELESLCEMHGTYIHRSLYRRG